MEYVDSGRRGRSRRVALSLIAALSAEVVLSACADAGSRPAAGTEAPTVRDSAGVEIVTNRGSGWSEGNAWRLEPDLGAGDVDGPLALGRISWVAPGPDRGMLVLDAQSHLVHSFDSLGGHMGSFGGEGDGPGEFRRPASATLVSDGRIAVSQGFPPVLHWVSSDGVLLSTVRPPALRAKNGESSAGSFAAWQVTRGGRVFVQLQILDPSAVDGAMPVHLLEIRSDGEAADTLASWTWFAGLGKDEPIRMFEPVRTWMPRADGSVVLSAEEGYSLEVVDAAAGLRRIVRRDWEPVPVTEEYRRRAIEDLRKSMGDGGAPDGLIDDLLDRIEFESQLPAITRVWVSESDGRVWVGVHDAELFAADTETSRSRDKVGLEGFTNAWDVFEADGRYLGRLAAPEGFSLRVAAGDALYGVWKNELEVQFARRYRIIRPTSAE